MGEFLGQHVNDIPNVSLHHRNQMGHVIRKPVYAICEEQRRRSACASAQSDQRLYCSLPR